MDVLNVPSWLVLIGGKDDIVHNRAWCIVKFFSCTVEWKGKK